MMSNFALHNKQCVKSTLKSSLHASGLVRGYVYSKQMVFRMSITYHHQMFTINATSLS